MSKLATQSKMTANGPVDGKAKKRHDSRIKAFEKTLQDGPPRTAHHKPGSMNAKKTGRS